MRLQGSTSFSITWPSNQLHRPLDSLSPEFASTGLSLCSLLIERNLLHMESIKTPMHKTQISNNLKLYLLCPTRHLSPGCPLLNPLRIPCFLVPQLSPQLLLKDNRPLYQAEVEITSHSLNRVPGVEWMVPSPVGTGCREQELCKSKPLKGKGEPYYTLPSSRF